MIRLALCAALALATAACGNPAKPSAAQVESARHTRLARLTAGNPQAESFPELIALGRNLNNEFQPSNTEESDNDANQ